MDECPSLGGREPRTIRRAVGAVALALSVGLISACATSVAPIHVGPSPRPTTSPGANGPGPSPRPTTAAGEPEGSPEFGAGITCAGDRWPPADLSGIEGIRVRSLDRATVEIANDTNLTWYYVLSGWEVARLESCVGLLPIEIERGPLPSRTIIRTSLGLVFDRPDLPITIAFWDAPCGEACIRRPEHPLLIERSLAQPASS